MSENIPYARLGDQPIQDELDGTVYVLVQPKDGAFVNQWGWVVRSWVDQNC